MQGSTIATIGVGVQAVETCSSLLSRLDTLEQRIISLQGRLVELRTGMDTAFSAVNGPAGLQPPRMAKMSSAANAGQPVSR